MSVSIQHADFDVGSELQALRESRPGQIGALVSFVGLVRDHASHGRVEAIELEHYPAMTARALEAIITDAERRWPLLGARVIHRIGYLAASEQIVLVAVASQHRQAAFEAAAYIMDFLKTRAPFWKKEYVGGVGHWVEAKQGDSAATDRWA